VKAERRALPAGDYAVRSGERIVAAVERKTLEDLAKALTDGSLGFLLAELVALPAAAVVVEERYSALLKVEHVRPGWLLEVIAQLQVRYPSVPIVFADSRKLAEEWTYRFLAAGLSQHAAGEAS
jgi:ERCC4-type nuclease